MAYRDFTFKRAINDLNLSLVEEKDAFGFVESIEPQAQLMSLLEYYHPLALGVGTEKSRSEFIIAPILAAARQHANEKFSLFSGVHFPVEPEKGLTGVCDFMLSRSVQQQFVTAPIVAIVEAKNENVSTGFGQCVAEMVAAQIFNEREGNQVETVYGSVTIGTIWRFLGLRGSEVVLDTREYYLERLDKILGILVYLAIEG